jgi:hypothetical protein
MWCTTFGAGKPPAGICAGGAGQPASLPRLWDKGFICWEKLQGPCISKHGVNKSELNQCRLQVPSMPK